jgi:hypothetical protein
MDCSATRRIARPAGRSRHLRSRHAGTARANVQVVRFVAELLMPNGDVHELHGYASIRLIKPSLIAAMVE